MIKMIEIDTNNGRYEGEPNKELFDLIVPKIHCLIDDMGYVLYSKDIDWQETLKSNCGCVYTEGLYISACEFTNMIVDISEWKDTMVKYSLTLSDLCDYLAEIYNIKTWTYKQQED